MEQTVKERLKVFIKYKGLSVNGFEKTCSLSQGFVKNIGKTIGTDSIGRILQTFPELSQIWLINGRGEMIKPEIDLEEDVMICVKNGKQKYVDKDVLAALNSFKKEISILNQRIENDIAELIKQNGKLVDIIEKLTN